MSEWLGIESALPWWAWTLMLIGVIALASVIGALFLPDWHFTAKANRTLLQALLAHWKEEGANTRAP